eukprot:4456118-Pleurochrysis_carterae.AAC.3
MLAVSVCLQEDGTLYRTTWSRRTTACRLYMFPERTLSRALVAGVRTLGKQTPQAVGMICRGVIKGESGAVSSGNKAEKDNISLVDRCGKDGSREAAALVAACCCFSSMATGNDLRNAGHVIALTHRISTRSKMFKSSILVGAPQARVCTKGSRAVACEICGHIDKAKQQGYPCKIN